MAFSMKKTIFFWQDDYEQFQKHLSAGRLRTATLLLYLSAKKLFPNVDPDLLYDECWRRTIQIGGTNGKLSTDKAN